MSVLQYVIFGSCLAAEPVGWRRLSYGDCHASLQAAADAAAEQAPPAVVSSLSADAAPFVLGAAPPVPAQHGVSAADEAPPGLQAEAGVSTASAARRSRRRQPAGQVANPPPGFGGKPSSRPSGGARHERERRPRQPVTQASPTRV